MLPPKGVRFTDNLLVILLDVLGSHVAEAAEEDTPSFGPFSDDGFDTDFLYSGKKSISL